MSLSKGLTPRLQFSTIFVQFQFSLWNTIIKQTRKIQCTINILLFKDMFRFYIGLNMSIIAFNLIRQQSKDGS